MAAEENLRIAEQVNDAANRRDWEGFSAGHTESVLVYSPMTPEPTKDVKAHTESVKGLLSAFPDFSMKLERKFGQGDWVCAEFLMTGTHKGPLRGPNGDMILATNKPVRLSICSIIRFKDGKMAEEHTYFDRVSLMNQLGVLPK